MSNRAQALLRLENISRVYEANDSAPALKSVNLTVNEGEFVAIVGASGAGKSTLLNLLGLLDTPSSGAYWIDGVEVSELTEHHRDSLRADTFGFIFQDSYMLVKETVATNVSLGLRVNSVELARRPDIIREALAAVGLETHANHRAMTLSGGERQRAAIARAIAPAPRVILADEPTGALDSTNSHNVLRILRELHGAGTTVIMITHDLELAQTADRIVEISDGEIIADSAAATPNTARNMPRALLRAPSNSQTRFSKLSENFFSAVSVHTVHAARALLLLLAFTLGSCGLVTATALSQSAASQVMQRFESASLDSFLVVPQIAHDAIRQQLGIELSTPNSEVARIAKSRLQHLKGVLEVGAKATTSFGDKIMLLDPNRVTDQQGYTAQAVVMDDSYLHLSHPTFVYGAENVRMFAFDTPYPAVYISQDLAQKLGLSAQKPGAQIWLQNTPVALAGVFSRLGDGEQPVQGMIANSELSQLLGADEYQFRVRTEPGAPAQLSELVGAAITPGAPGLYTAETVSDLRSLSQSVTNDLVALINFVSWGLLLLASLSAATAMYLSVQARTAEIALRRAVGESRRSVWSQFVLEGAAIGLVGGMFGSGMGVILAVQLAHAQGWNPTFSYTFVALGIVTGVVSGVVASAYPAAVAARKDPAIAVRGV